LVGSEMCIRDSYSILVLFSIGVTKGKWGSLVAAMMEFKKHYDANTALEELSLIHIFVLRLVVEKKNGGGGGGGGGG
ncbi:hypothetical protein QN399_26430, partial [Pseudomonas sp. 10C3]